MIKNSKIILLYLILISCNSEEKKVVHYFKNGKIKDVEFYNSNDSILKKINYTENGSLDSEIYYKNGKVQISKFYQDSKLNLEYDFRDSLHSFQNFLFNGVLVFGKGKTDSKSR